MAVLSEVAGWDGVYQIETGDRVGPAPIGVSNDPHQNLANMSLFVKNELNNLVKVGSILPVAKGVVPDGYLQCDGSYISRATYAALFDEIGELYGYGDGSTTFALPDFRGKFLRGLNEGSGNNPDAQSPLTYGDAAPRIEEVPNWSSGDLAGKIENVNQDVVDRLYWIYNQGLAKRTGNIFAAFRNLSTGALDAVRQLAFTQTEAGVLFYSGATTGEWGDLTHDLFIVGDVIGADQEDGFVSHTHIMPDIIIGVAPYVYGYDPWAGSTNGGNMYAGYVTDPTGGNESRPINAAVMYCIRYKEI